MSEAPRGTQEAGGRHEAELFWPESGGRRFTFEALADDVVDTADMDEIEAESAPAGAIDSGAAVLVDQPQQFLRLPEVSPREGAIE